MIHIRQAKLAKAKAVTAVKTPGQPKKENPFVSPARAREAIRLAHADGRYGSWFGLAFLRKEFTEAQYNAGVAFAGAAKARERALASPGCNPRAQDVSAAGGRSLAQESDATIKRHRSALRRWSEIEVALTPLELRAMDIIVTRMREPEGYVQQLALRAALQKLVTLWKSPRRRR